MDRIKALPPEVYNLISAGELIDNPAGAVKELVENSIDAGAKRVSIEIVGGGYDQIIVSDNGRGIHEDDLELAFCTHATSKLESASDLKAIMTLGFRGEALPSIAAVSRVKLTTRSRAMETGVCVSVENGVVSNKQYVPFNVGTQIEVRDLYYNAPVRRKFLKNEAGEKANVTKFVAKLILTNPNLAISYRADGKTIFESNGGGLDAAIFAVYGGDCLSNCLPINYSHGDLRIQGYIGTPEYSKPNRNYQTLSVNGRCVTDVGISAAISQAYSNTLMQHKFPFFVLDIELPADIVDVNIHPKKDEVKFAGSRHVCGQFYHAVEDALSEYKSARSKEIFAHDFPIIREETPPMFTKEDVLSKVHQLQDSGEIETMNPAQKTDVMEIEALSIEAEKQRRMDEFAESLGRELSVAKARQKFGFDPITPAAVEQESVSAIVEDEPPTFLERDEGDELLDRARILGVAFRTYLIIEIDEKVIFVDQHAAHERMLFDKFLQGVDPEMQQMAYPYTFSVSDDEALFITENRKNILAAGIDVKPFGPNTFRITAVSSLLTNTPMIDFVNYLLASIDEFNLDDRKLIVEAIAKKACKAAIKAGQKLNEDEIKYILKEIYHNKILQCPHGRPITIVFTKTQLEKMFKRIV